MKTKSKREKKNLFGLWIEQNYPTYYKIFKIRGFVLICTILITTFFYSYIIMSISIFLIVINFFFTKKCKKEFLEGVIKIPLKK